MILLLAYSGPYNHWASYKYAYQKAMSFYTETITTHGNG